MIKLKLTSFLFLLSFMMFAQENTQRLKNEIKLNAAYLIAGIPEFGYERLINEESSFGVDLLISIDRDTEIEFATTPYYRLYFGKKPNAGFFAEGFGMLNFSESSKISSNGFDGVYNSSKETDFALGVAIGGKLITVKGFTFEFYSGIGRNLFNENSTEVIPRMGLTFGRRF